MGTMNTCKWVGSSAIDYIIVSNQAHVAKRKNKLYSDGITDCKWRNSGRISSFKSIEIAYHSQVKIINGFPFCSTCTHSNNRKIWANRRKIRHQIKSIMEGYHWFRKGEVKLFCLERYYLVNNTRKFITIHCWMSFIPMKSMNT